MKKYYSRLIFVTAIYCMLAAMSCLGQEVVRVGYYDNPPKLYRNDEQKVVGIFPEIISDIAQQENWKIEYIDGTWQECLKRLKNGKIDIMPDVAYSEERAQKYLFGSESVLINWGIIYNRKGVAISRILDLHNKTVAVMKGSIHTDGKNGIKAMLKSFDIPCQYIEVNSYHEVFGLIDSGKADAGVVNRLFGTLEKTNYEVEATTVVFNPRHLMFAFPKNNRKSRHFQRLVDRHLQRLKNDPKSILHVAIESYLSGSTTPWELTKKITPALSVELTCEEKEWIRKHPVIRLGVDPQFAPFEFIRQNGEYAGLAADYVQMLSKKLGLEFRVVPNLTWQEVIDKAINGEIDVLPCVSISELRKKYLSFTQSYIAFPRVILTREKSLIKSMDNLKGLKVAVHEKSSHHDFIEDYKEIEAVLRPSFQTAMKELSQGKHDAVIGNLATATHTMREMVLTNLKIASYVSDETFPLSCAVRKDWQPLLRILNKGLDSISEDERRDILQKWIPVHYLTDLEKPAEPLVGLSETELNWLEEHPVIRVAGDPDWAPLMYIDDKDKFHGVTVEYINRLSEMTGVQLKFIKTDSWADSLEMIKNGEADLLACATDTPLRRKFASFTPPYISLPAMIFTSDDVSYIHDHNELRGKRVAVIKGYAMAEYLRREFPEVEVVETADIDQALQMLSSGEIFAYVGTILVTTRRIRDGGYANIMVAGQMPVGIDLAIGVRKDWPILVGILRKGLDAITEKEHNSFYRKWVSLKYQHAFDYSLLWKTAIPLAFLLLFFVLWSWILKIRVRRQTLEYKMIADELKVSENKLRELLLNIDDVVYSLTVDGTFAYISPHIKSYGYDPNMLIGKPVSALAYTSDRKLVAKHFLAPSTGKKSNSAVEFRIIDSHRRPHWIEDRGHALYDDDGKFSGRSGAMRNITKRKESEIELREYRNQLEVIVAKRTADLEHSMSLLSATIDATADGMLVVNNREDVQIFNRKFCEMFKIKDVVIKNESKLLRHITCQLKNAEKFVESIRELYAHPEAESMDQIYFKDGRVFERISIPRKLGEKIDGRVWCFRDVTVREKSEEMLMEAKLVAEEANRSKSEFLASMSHELRTPLNSIIGFSQMLEEKYFGDLTEKQEKYVGNILSSGQHLLSLINDILDISKIEAGKMELTIESFDLAELVEKSMVMIQEKAFSHQISLKFEVADTAKGAIINADERKLKQIMFNLLSNAAKFTPDNGSISVDVSLKSKGVALISVKDSGIGIAADDQSRVFESFEQVKGSSIDKTPGTGLGLPLTKSFVEMHGGNIWLESDGENSGSRFSFTIPLEVTTHTESTT